MASKATKKDALMAKKKNSGAHAAVECNIQDEEEEEEDEEDEEDQASPLKASNQVFSKHKKNAPEPATSGTRLPKGKGREGHASTKAITATIKRNDLVGLDSKTEFFNGAYDLKAMSSSTRGDMVHIFLGLRYNNLT